jgi:Flp pilus assembly pilin Flp
MWTNRSPRGSSPRSPSRRPSGFGRSPSRGRPGLGADRSGVTAIEYALMGAFILGAIVAAVSGYGDGLGALMASSFALVAAAM